MILFLKVNLDNWRRVSVKISSIFFSCPNRKCTWKLLKVKIKHSSKNGRLHLTAVTNMWKMTARNHRELKLSKSKLKKQPRNVAGANRDSSQSNGRLYYRLFFFLFFPTLKCSTVRSGAEERSFSRARLDVFIFRLRSYHVLNHYIAEGNRQKSEKYMTFLVQAGTFLCFQAGRSSATCSSASDLIVHLVFELEVNN